MYKKELKEFHEWLDGLPVTDESISRYITHLFERGKVPRLITPVITAIRSASKFTDIPSLVGPITQRILTEVRRKGRDRGQMDGLKWEQVELLMGIEEVEGEVINLRNTALLSTMSDAMLRAGEATQIQVKDVWEEEDGSGRSRIPIPKPTKRA